MKVILTQDVRGQGKRGQMIEVSDGYARNFLLPRKLAQEATADNINTMRMNDKATQERQAKERAEALELRNRMKDMTVVVTAKGGGAGRLFGSVTTQEIADALAAQTGINPNTAQKAYRLMTEEGYVVTDGNSGSFVRLTPALREQISEELTRGLVEQFVTQAKANRLSYKKVIALVSDLWGDED